ncbi:MAG: c-type cytochrome [Acidobacteria bacterium]|nr:c-type cytochrome [Acidobacteriota bacterium]
MRTTSQRWTAVVFMMVIGIVGMVGFSTRTISRTALAHPAETPEPAPIPAPFDQKAALAKLREQIKGHEKEPAEKVFKNIKMFTGMPAERLLNVMDLGMTHALGRDCTLCHIPDKWESDENPDKQIARDMNAMMGTINRDLLKKIPNLSQNAFVNCTTCHRGEVKPAINMPPPPKAS